MNKQFIGTTIALGALISIFLIIGQAIYSAPGSEEVDTGLKAIPSGTERSQGEGPGEQVATAGPIGGGVSNESHPSRLEIPKLGISAHVQRLGVTESGNMAAPDNFTDVSWYKYGTVPGQKGSAVMAGHEDNALSLDGVFKHLNKLEVGDSIYVVNKDGKRLHFKVIDERVYPYDNAPLQKIFADSGGTYLNLITCDGDWLPEAKTNDKRLVVYTRLVE